MVTPDKYTHYRLSNDRNAYRRYRMRIEHFQQLNIKDQSRIGWNAIASTTAGYTFDGRRLTIDGRTACEVVTLTRQQMLLRKQVQQGVYQETTFKRR